jgi:ATP-dependent DNA helicase RecQ
MSSKYSEADIVKHLKSLFKLKKLNKGQLEPIIHFANGKHTVLIMPTGGGKSLCFQLPLLLREGLGIVISPLLALINDQVGKLRKLDVDVVAVHSNQSVDEMQEAIDSIAAGLGKILYVSPERFVSDSFLEMIQGRKIAGIAIDEAHCIDQWGFNFRPSYLELKSAIKKLGTRIPLMATTATATINTQKVIIENLGIGSAKLFKESIQRKNIFYEVYHLRSRRENPDQPRKRDFLEQVLLKHRGQSGIIYVPTRASTQTLWKRAKYLGVDAIAYHAGLHRKVRSDREKYFMDNECVAFATIAFGMGIDKSNVRFVAHYGLPENIERFHQESGRCGRDGKPAFSYVISGPSDLLNLHFNMQGKGYENGVLEKKKTELSSLEEFLFTKRCRQKILLSYFGETLARNCGRCDNCKAPTIDLDRSTSIQSGSKLQVESRESGIRTSIVGLGYYQADKLISSRKILEGSLLDLVREPDNPYDGNAVSVEYKKVKVGHLSRALAASLSERIDGGIDYVARVMDVSIRHGRAAIIVVIEPK